MAEGLGRLLTPRRSSIRGRGGQERVALAACGVALAVLVVLPIVWPGAELVRAGAGAMAGAAGPLASQSLWALLARSMALAGAVTAGALLVGVPMGVLLARTDVAGRRWAFAVHALPMFLPPFLIGLGWFHILGRQGLVGGAWSSSLLFGETGVVVVLVLAFAPVVTALTGLGLAGIDPSLEEAGRVVAPAGRVLCEVLLPLARPAIALGALVVFALAFSELGVPMFLRVKAYPGTVFARLGGIDYSPGEAVALVLPMLGVAFVILAVERRLRRRYSFASLGFRSRTPWHVELGRSRALASAGVWTIAALSVSPLAGLLARTWRGGGFGMIGDWIGGSVVTSLVAGVAAATVATGLSLVVGHAIARDSRAAVWLDIVAVLGFVTPAAVLGVGMVALWNRPSTEIVYRSIAIIVIGDLARYAVVGIRTAAVAIAQSPASLEAAAAASGAGYIRRLLQIVLPLHVRGLAASWLLTLLFCLRDLEMAVLFYPPGLEPLPVRIFTLEANGPEAVVAALALVHSGITALVLGGGAALLLGRPH